MKNIVTKNYKLKSRKMSVKPFIFTRPSVSSISLRFIVLLSLQVLMLIFTKSYKSLLVVFVSFIGALAAASLDYLINKSQPYKFMNVIIQGLMIGLLLPSDYPALSVFFISFVTLFTARSLVFKKVDSWICLSALAVVVAWFIGQRFFPPFAVTSEIVEMKNSSVYLIQNGTFPISSLDSAFTSFLNNGILKLFHTSIPEGLVSMLWDNHSVIPAFRFNILTIISSIFIFSDNAFSLIIPSIFLVVYGTLVRLFSSFIFGGAFNQGDVFLALFTSGVLFGTVFQIQWFGSIPVTTTGKVIQGILLGIIGFLVIGCGTSPIGMAYTVLIGNISSMMIRVFEERKNNHFVTKSYSVKAASKGEI